MLPNGGRIGVEEGEGEGDGNYKYIGNSLQFSL